MSTTLAGDMKVQMGPDRLPPHTAACLGAFDGMHLGHQALLLEARRHAPAVAVVTFEPHPATVLAPARRFERLQTPAQRERVCRTLGVDTLVTLPFDGAVARLSPAAFAEQYISAGLCPRTVVVGHDFRFGAERRGDVDELERLLRPHAIAVVAVAEVEQPLVARHVSEELSSTSIRRALAQGEVVAAAAMLGRWYAAAGKVVRGAGRGRGLGIPTANVEGESTLPRTGIYATWLSVVDETSDLTGSIWPSVASIGTNPTFVTRQDAPTVLEVHVYDHDLGESLYGVEVEVSFVSRLRDETKFDSVAALLAQIHADIAQARTFNDARARQQVWLGAQR